MYLVKTKLTLVYLVCIAYLWAWNTVSNCCSTLSRLPILFRVTMAGNQGLVGKITKEIQSTHSTTTEEITGVYT